MQRGEACLSPSPTDKGELVLSRENNIIWKSLIAAQKIVMFITGMATMIIVALAMVLRFFFNVDLVGYEEVLAMVAMWLYMIGSAYGSYEKSQIAADILNLYLKEGKLKTTVNVLRSGLTLGLGLVFNVWAWQFAVWAITMNTRTPVWRLPMVIGQGSIFVGLTLMSFYNIVYFYDDIKAAVPVFKKQLGKEECL
jgi:TRAP-type C4-dicarboxylate transport system permease small subunit